ncbi:hypothetical protein [Hymenobacter sp. BT190]|uniref:hypothetical protein n=1 Tax=Hymenobacter sp. BT190 TaxID=2763505 RepID=UPI0016518775|nr:hypothetical protein [Hymenobacter sp. BT190]MBC6700044.1 hypothetical protein [Hymenobacter sp. BT190]
MRTPAALVLGLLLAAGPLPGRGGRVGEGLPRWLSTTGPLPLPAHTARPPSGVMAATHLPDTSRRPPADTLRQRPALVPDPPSSVTDDDKPTRKTALFAALALAVLTVSTLLLYNVRSR